MIDKYLMDSAVAADTEALQPQNGRARNAAGPDQTKSNILDTIGNTPLIELNNIFGDKRFKLFGKIEALNPGGSIKDRCGLHILREALSSGKISRDTTIIESSSGNMAIGLAQVCAYWSTKLICVVDIRTTKQIIRILEAYGAVISLVSEPLPGTDNLLGARKLRVQQLLASVPDSYCPDQYANPNNFAAHYLGTMPEIVNALKSRVDYLFLATSTSGTLRGCAEYIRDNKLPTKVVAVDAIGSVIFGDKPQSRLLPGHGAAEKSRIHLDGLADDVVLISDWDCITGCHNLVRREAVLAGASSGGVIAAIHKYHDQIEPGAVCAAILADRGERYLDTVYSDDWVLQNFDQLPDSTEYSRI
ncbi:MAG: 2,3-diaminopropionate biosynthesis protein SbnA [Gammaproteobacteria bacterium]|nr:2,3-diaminopropionate biosynthesis protein SbnA [Gammaproteobacteria bacterium]